MNLTYTIYDADPATSGFCAWPEHDGQLIEAPSPGTALDEALDIAVHCGRACGEYEPGHVLYVIVWDEDYAQVANGSVEI